jgi:hypothetical protein
MIQSAGAKADAKRKEKRQAALDAKRNMPAVKDSTPKKKPNNNKPGQKKKPQLQAKNPMANNRPTKKPQKGLSFAQRMNKQNIQKKKKQGAGGAGGKSPKKPPMGGGAGGNKKNKGGFSPGRLVVTISNDGAKFPSGPKVNFPGKMMNKNKNRK